MANALEVCFKRIHNTIPDKVLQEAFQPHLYFTTLDDRIHEEVIMSRVFSDINLSAGRVTRIPLLSSYAENTKLPRLTSLLTTGAYTIYRIPPEVRENKRIVACVALDYPPYMYDNNIYQSLPGNCCKVGTSAKDLACAVLNSITGNGAIWRPTPICINGDLIEIDPPQSAHIDWIVTVRLEYDDQFTNMNNDAIFPLANLVECATKAYVYNKLIFKIEEAFLEGGLELGKMRELVESYADQNEKYEELLKELRGSTLLDRKRLMRVISMML